MPLKFQCTLCGQHRGQGGLCSCGGKLVLCDDFPVDVPDEDDPDALNLFDATEEDEFDG